MECGKGDQEVRGCSEQMEYITSRASYPFVGRLPMRINDIVQKFLTQNSAGHDESGIRRIPPEYGVVQEALQNHRNTDLKLLHLRCDNVS